MNPINIPLVANWNLISATAACPDGGILYIGFKSVNYISAIESDEDPVIKSISTRQKVKSIDVDPDWSETKYFVALADDNTIQIWDVNDSKAKKGHKAHIKASLGDGDGPSSELVAICFLRNRSVLSIDSSSIVKYCVNSNRYTKMKRIISTKHTINIVKACSSDENLIAFGSTRGLIFLVNLTSETIISTLCGHSREVTSLSWLAVSLPTPSRPIKTPLRKLSRKKYAAVNTTIDEVFDIYDFEYLENEFGAPALDYKKDASDTESVSESVGDGSNEVANNENFNFIEACKSLKDEILAKQQLSGPRDSPSKHERQQVTLEDCQQAVRDRDEGEGDGSFDCDSELSVEFPESSENSLADDFENSCAINSTLRENKQLEPLMQNIYLASASVDGTVWVWNTKTGESVDQISLKGSQGQHSNYIDVAWLNPNTLVLNDKSNELAVYSCSPTVDKKTMFKREKYECRQRGVVGVCKMVNSTTVWTISSRRELVCENILTKEILAKYSCVVTRISSIRENPFDMNRIAIAFPDRRIGLMSLGSITPKNIPIDIITLKEEMQILSLCWCPNDQYLAFGTAEGRVGVVDTEKSQKSVVMMKPFSGSSVYSLSWSDNKIFVCSQEKVAYYDWNDKTLNATKLDYIVHGSSIALHENELFVGTQSGDVMVFKRSDSKAVDFKLLSAKNIAAKYISEISVNPLNPSLIAVSAMSSNVAVLKFSGTTLEIEHKFVTNASQAVAGSTCVKWSNKNEHLLLSCGFDGTVRIWDLSRPAQEALLCLKQFDSPMLSAIFSPINEDIVICAGKASSIQMFDYKKEVSVLEPKPTSKKNKDKHLGEVQWGTKLENAMPLKKKSKLKSKEVNTSNNNSSMLARLKELKDLGNEEPTKPEQESNCSLKNSSTVLHLLGKEFNKDVLQNIEKVLDDPSNSVLMAGKLFGSRRDAEEILEAELKNHQGSNMKSIGCVMLPQISGNLKEEIIECIKTKKLNETLLSLAPSISYDFWKKCCKAYANQLLEVGLILNASMYLLACHQVNDCIQHLVEKHYYREAWIVAKVYVNGKDPIFGKILKTWVEHMSLTGNYEGAALLCTLSGDYPGALKCLSERRQQNDEHRRIAELLESKIEK